jgi:hypothetical protein
MARFLAVVKRGLAPVRGGEKSMPERDHLLRSELYLE